jgi:acyl-coenzyme A thioesterase PaaI-like protein
MMEGDRIATGKEPATERKVEGTQNVSRMCLVCGTENALGLHARFLELDNGDVVGVFTPRPEHQGYPGRLHGGIVAAILDETIGRAVNAIGPGTWGVTAELTVRYRAPVPVDREVRVVGRITRDAGRLFEGHGEIVVDGKVAAEARGKYVRLPIDDIVDEEFTRLNWFPDPGEAPDSIDL